MSDEPSSVDESRVLGTTIVKPIVFGSLAYNLTKKKDSENHTHAWVVYVKPFHNEDMSGYVKKVQFKLHDTYKNPVRVVTEPPYEVQETGWGEFEIQIKIFFRDPAEKPVTMFHLLKLFHINEAITSVVQVEGRRAVVSEFYEEIIFQNPTQSMMNFLKVSRPFLTGTHKHETNFDDRKSKMMAAIQTGRSGIQSEILKLRQKLFLAKETISKFKDEIGKVEGDSAPSDSASLSNDR